jgi:hypothetical protein
MKHIKGNKNNPQKSLSIRNQFINDFTNVLPTYTHQLPSQILNKTTNNICKDSWVKSDVFLTKPIKHTLSYKSKFPTEVINCQKVKMLLSKDQQLIIDIWMDSYTKMYNATLEYIRNNCDTFKNTIIKSKLATIDTKKYVNSFALRSKLKGIRDQIQKDSQLKSIKYNTQIHTHTLDYAIRQLVSNIKSAITNMKRGNFKRFRLKFWSGLLKAQPCRLKSLARKNVRPSKSIDIELQYIKNDVICPNVLGLIKYEYNKKPFQLKGITSGVKINYNSITEEYTLLIPIKHNPQQINNNLKKEVISLDLGLRTFATGLSENEALKIGTNVNSQLRKKISRLNKIKRNREIPNRIKKKNEKMINRQIYNKVDDLHWFGLFKAQPYRL